MAKKLTALRALVDVKGEYVLVLQGEDIPSGVTKQELARLEKAGAIESEFGERSNAPAVKDLDDQALAAWVLSTEPEEIVKTVGSDTSLAERVLAAEDQNTSGAPRPELAEALKA